MYFLEDSVKLSLDVLLGIGFSLPGIGLDFKF